MDAHDAREHGVPVVLQMMDIVLEEGQQIVDLRAAHRLHDEPRIPRRIEECPRFSLSVLDVEHSELILFILGDDRPNIVQMANPDNLLPNILENQRRVICKLTLHSMPPRGAGA